MWNYTSKFVEMPLELTLFLLPEEIADKVTVLRCAALAARVTEADVVAVQWLRKSLDARQKPLRFQLKVRIFTTGELNSLPIKNFIPQFISDSKTCHIIGAGPAGLFAALQCIERGIKPIIIERGKAVEERLHDIATLHKKGLLNPESNYCYGEGGAGTYSDGKLYTRSTKRGDVQKVLDVFVANGADSRIVYEAHPHIGTNKLPRIIAHIRQQILEWGGEIYFQKKLVDFELESNRIKSIVCSDGSHFEVQQLLLATGHSARDIYELLHANDIFIDI